MTLTSETMNAYTMYLQKPLQKGQFGRRGSTEDNSRMVITAKGVWCHLGLGSNIWRGR